MEMLINADMAYADASAKFGLPEVTKGVIAIAGGITRIARVVGMQRASEMALVGGTYTAQEMERWGLVNAVVPDGGCLERAMVAARGVAGNSPDAVVVSREGLRMGWEGVRAARGETRRVEDGEGYRALLGGENYREGVKSFGEKRKPVWRDSKI